MNFNSQVHKLEREKTTNDHKFVRLQKFCIKTFTSQKEEEKKWSQTQVPKQRERVRSNISKWMQKLKKNFQEPN